jgi:hypothetical protein
MDIQKVLYSSDFQGLPPQEKEKFLNDTLPDFAGLPPAEKRKFIFSLKVATPQKEPEKKSYKPKQTPSRKTSFLEELPVVGGSILGGVLGGPVGAAVGAAGAKGIDLSMKSLLGLPEAPRTSEEAAKQVGWAGLREGALEKGGRLFMGGVQKVVSPAAKTIIPEVKKMASFVGQKVKPAFLPAEMTTGRLADFIHNFAEKAIFGGKIEQFKRMREDAFSEFADEFIEQFGAKSSSWNAGEATVEAYTAINQKIRDIFDPFYEKISKMVQPKLKKVPVPRQITSGILDSSGKPITKIVIEMVEKKVGGAKIPMAKIKKFAQERLKRAKLASGIDSEASGAKLLEGINNYDDFVDFETAKELRTLLRIAHEKFDIVNKKAPVYGMAKYLEGQVDKAIGTGLRKFSPKAYELWRNTNATYKVAKEKFDNQLIRRLVKAGLPPSRGGRGQPEQVAKMLFRPNNYSQVATVKKMMGGSSPEWKNLQSYFTQSIIDASRKTATDPIIGNRLLKKLETMGEDTLRVIYSPDQLSAIKMLGKAIKTTQDQQGGGIGGIIAQLTQGSALAGAGIGIATGEYNILLSSLGLLASPNIAARALTNPTFVKYLTRAQKLSPTSKNLPIVAAKLAAMLARIKKESDKHNEEINPELGAL